MKTSAAGALTILLVSLLLPIAVSPLGAQQLAAPAPLTNAADTLSWQITHRDFHSQTWEASALVLDPISGKTRSEMHRFVEL